MYITHFTISQDGRHIGSVPVREQAVDAAKGYAVRTGRPVSVVAHIDDGRTREVVYYPDGTIDRIWEREEKKAWSDDKKRCFGVVGTIGDLLREGILEYADYSPETWAFIPAPGVIQKPWFGPTREAALANLPKM